MSFYKLLLSFIVTAASATATVTISLNVQGLENSSGTATNGMSFGLVVDTGNDGFQAGSYTTFDLSTNGQFLNTTSGATDDWFVYGGTLGTGQTAPTTSSPFPLGTGSIGTVSGVEFTNLASGDEFAIIWFPSNSTVAGSSYGFARDTGSNMVIPSDGNESVVPDDLTTKSTDFQVVPEPSQYGVFMGLLVIGLVVNRRKISS